jgi:hypothetical protein
MQREGNTAADAALRDLLAPGQRDSRAVQAAMAGHGFTPKQTRRARERLGLEVSRAGNGPNTRTTWALPSEGTALDAHIERDPVAPPTAAASSRALKEKVRQAKALDAHLEPFEQRRIEQRVELFMCKGIDRFEAARVAHRLVLERDRTGSRDGSCAECQCLQPDGRCAVATAGLTQGPRPVHELWQCGFARRSGP